MSIGRKLAEVLKSMGKKINFSAGRILAVMHKELIQLWCDKPTLTMIIFMPIMQIVIFGYAINMDPKQLPTAIYMRDDSLLSRSFISGLQASDYFNINAMVHSDEEGRKLLQMGQSQFVVSIPENFQKDIIRGKHPEILIEADATDPVAIGNALASLAGILETVLHRDLKGSLAFLQKTPAAYGLVVHRAYNPEGFTRYNVIPGIIGLILTMTGIMMTAMALTRERERGTMENLMAMPVRPSEIMIGKIMPFLLIGFVQTFIILGSARWLFAIPILGSVWLLSFGVLLFFLCNLALGFTISSFSRQQFQALQLSVFVFVPSILLSDFAFPFRGMPQWAQWIGSCMPMTYFIRFARGIMLKGSILSEVLPQINALVIFLVITMSIAMLLYKRTLD